MIPVMRNHGKLLYPITQGIRDRVYGICLADLWLPFLDIHHVGRNFALYEDYRHQFTVSHAVNGDRLVGLTPGHTFLRHSAGRKVSIYVTDSFAQKYHPQRQFQLT